MDPMIVPQCFSMSTVRREQLREFIEAHQIVTIKQLTELLPEVSAMTIHRDLHCLQEQGLVEKIRGGARWIPTSAREAVFAEREGVAGKAKGEIAKKAVELLRDSSSVFIDAGTTMMAFARAIPDRRINVVTTGPNVALELAARRDTAITLCGGALNKSNLTLSGTAAMTTLAAINIDTAFIAPSGYSKDAGFTCGVESEARIKSLVIGKARTAVMLMDSSKLERVLPYTFADLDGIDYLVTELEPEQLPDTFRAGTRALQII